MSDYGEINIHTA